MRNNLSPGKKLIQWAVGITPTVVGGAISASLGGSDLGLAAVSGAEIGLQAKDMVNTFFTQRTEEKCVTVIENALLEIENLVKKGHGIRQDWVDKSETVTGLIEHALMIAKDTYESQKLTYISIFLARTICNSKLSVDDAHRYYKQFEDLTWREIKVLSAFYNVKIQSDIYKQNIQPKIYLGMRHEEMYAHSGCVMLLTQKNLDSLPVGLGAAARTLMVEGMVQSAIYQSSEPTVYYDIVPYGIKFGDLFELNRMPLEEWSEYAAELTKDVLGQKVAHDYVVSRHKTVLQ